MRTTYRKKLLDPRWQKKRLETLERFNWACCACASKDRTLHVHHGAYLKDHEPWDAPQNSLWVLCDCCHVIATQLAEATKDAIGHVHPMALFRVLWMVRLYVLGHRGGAKHDHSSFVAELDALLERTLGWRPGYSVGEAMLEADSALSGEENPQ